MSRSIDGLERLLVYGCGPLAWARWQDGVDVEPTTGRLDETVAIEPRGRVSLTEALDRPWGWLPRSEPPKPSIEIHHGDPGELPLLPSWEDLAARQAEEVTRELGDPGVLVSPACWRENPKGRLFLKAWSALGWHWAALEEVLRLRFDAGIRFAVPGGDWLRLEDGERRATLPNGPEAALALQLAEPLLKRLLDTLEPTLADRWWRDEQSKSGWFVRQRLVRSIVRALRNGETNLELGATSDVLFAVSSPRAQQTFEPLTALRLSLDLPAATPPAAWWKQVGEPGFLRPPGQGDKRFTPRWEEGETLVLEHPAEKFPDRPEQYQLREHLHFNSRPYRTEDPARLRDSRVLAKDLGPWLERQLIEDEQKLLAATRPVPTADSGAATPDDASDGSPARPVDEAPPPVGDPIDEDGFEPRSCRLDTPHRPSSVSIRRLSEGASREEAELPFALVEPEPGKVLYQIDGEEPLRHGALIRIDYDPKYRQDPRSSGSRGENPS